MPSTMTHPAPRARLIEALASALRDRPWALAAWLGGSDANGRTDELSDIDLVVIVEDDRVEEAVALCEAAVRTVAPIVPRLTAWPEHSPKPPKPPKPTFA